MLLVNAISGYVRTPLHETFIFELGGLSPEPQFDGKILV
ncbi:hypothetical protein ADU37_CDS20210 [Thermococcus sp. 2319x1]|nr:hypothetical protein ADU37_CDS20210 [Thermococcus sp. 2319x1]